MTPPPSSTTAPAVTFPADADLASVFDVVVVGGGAGGLAAVRAARWAGARVALVSDGPPGGDCTFSGCVPSKALLAAAAAGVDGEEAFVRVRRAVETVAASETPERLAAHGAVVVLGRGRLAAPDLVIVGDRRLRARHVILATGSRPALPPLLGLDDVEALTNETLFELTAPPRSLLVIGAGAVGCEMAQAFARLGTAVSLVELADRVLPLEEPDVSAVVAGALAADGVALHTGVRLERVAERDGRIVAVGGGLELSAERLLVATGRRPNSEGLGLEEVGIQTDPAGHIVVDDRLVTSVRSVRAVGDVTGRSAFTHAADEMGRLAVGNALRKGVRGRFRAEAVPVTIFTDPEVARVGLTEAEAAARGGRVAELPLTEMDRAITDGRTEGFIRLVAGPRRLTRNLFGGRVLGATIVAPRAGEMIAEVVLALRAGTFTGRLAQAVHAYPTWSYGIQKAAGQFFGDVEGRRARRAGGR